MPQVGGEIGKLQIQGYQFHWPLSVKLTDDVDGLTGRDNKRVLLHPYSDRSIACILYMELHTLVCPFDEFDIDGTHL